MNTIMKAKYMLMSHHQTTGQNHNIKTANRSFENVAKFKYLEMIVTYQNLIEEEIMVMFASIQFGNFCLLVCYLKA
jgi:hypothetical protein